jgi:hypothetical protein
VVGRDIGQGWVVQVFLEPSLLVLYGSSILGLNPSTTIYLVKPSMASVNNKPSVLRFIIFLRVSEPQNARQTKNPGPQGQDSEL